MILSVEKYSAHLRGCYALEIYFIVCLILFRERIWLEHKSTLEQIIYVIFTLKNSLMPWDCLSADGLQIATFPLPKQRVTYSRAAISPGFPRTLLNYTCCLNIFIPGSSSHAQKNPTLDENFIITLINKNLHNFC